jgi:hypothetical protein
VEVHPKVVLRRKLSPRLKVAALTLGVADALHHVDAALRVDFPQARDVLGPVLQVESMTDNVGLCTWRPVTSRLDAAVLMCFSPRTR